MEAALLQDDEDHGLEDDYDQEDVSMPGSSPIIRWRSGDPDLQSWTKDPTS